MFKTRINGVPHTYEKDIIIFGRTYALFYKDADDTAVLVADNLNLMGVKRC